MRVLVIASGGREHALCWSIAASPLCDKLFCAPGNAGIAAEATCVPLNPADQAADLGLDATEVVVPGARAGLARRGRHACGASAMSSSSRFTDVRSGTSLMKSTATSAPIANGRATRKM